MGIAESYNPAQASYSKTTGKFPKQSRRQSFREENRKLRGADTKEKSVSVNWESHTEWLLIV